MNIAAGSEKKTILNSLLTESAFSKIVLTLNLAEKGILAKADGKIFSPDKLKFTFTEWSFEGTTVEDQSNEVMFEGKGFEGRPLLAVLQSNQQAVKARAVFSLAACIGQALKENISLPANGAGGILYRENNGKPEFLFLPENLFEKASANASGENYAELQGFWLDKSFFSDNEACYNKNRALSFIRAAVIYNALTEELPFPEIDTEARQTDILDASYLPLKNKINGISEKLSDTISYALEYGSEAFSKEREASGLSVNKTEIKYADIDFPLEELSGELGLKEDGSIQIREHTKLLSDEEFEKQNQKFISKKKSKTDRTRFVRRNIASLVIAGIITVLVLAGVRSIYKESLSKPTSISLNETQTVEAFFSGLHNMDINLMSAVSAGKGVKPMIDSVSNVYVSSKMRSAYQLSTGTLTPEFWLYRHQQLPEYYQYGITGFEITENGTVTEGNSRFAAPKKKSRPEPVSRKEDGSPVNEGDTAQKTVSFNLVHSEGPQFPIISCRTSGYVTLWFHKNRWLVTGVEMSQTEESYNQEEFNSDFNKYIEETDGDILATAVKLSEKYPWVPGQKAIRQARIEYETTAEKRAQGQLY